MANKGKWYVVSRFYDNGKSEIKVVQGNFMAGYRDAGAYDEYIDEFDSRKAAKDFAEQEI